MTDIARTTIANLGRFIFLFRYFDAIVADISEVAKDASDSRLDWTFSISS
jgi:hypothetical protein